MSLWKTLKRTARAGGFCALLWLHGLVLQFSAPPQTFPTLNEALDTIAAKYKTHVGLEYAPNDQDSTPVSLNLSAATIDPVLNELIHQKPGYVWTSERGVYDIRPKSNRDSILDVVVKTYSVNNATPEQASKAISELPEVREWLAKRRVTRRELETAPPHETPGIRISLNLSGVTLRAVLNSLVQQFGRSNWIALRYGNNEQYIAIYL